MDVPQLVGIASELGLTIGQDDEREKVIYAILDKAAEQLSMEAEPKKKRTRIVKKDTDRVYTVSGKEGENFDVKNRGIKTVEPASLFSDAPVDKPTESPRDNETEEPTTDGVNGLTTPEVPIMPIVKHRGRKSKAELAAIAAAKAAMEAAQQAGIDAALPQSAPAGEESLAADAQGEATVSGNGGETTGDNVPEETFDGKVRTDGGEQQGMIEQLQQKMSTRNQARVLGGDNAADAEVTVDGVWEGDPGDGTDFITVVDLPTADQAAMPTLDIFDRPTTRASQQAQSASQLQEHRTGEPGDFDFGDLISGNGVLEMMQDGYGFLRASDYNYLSSPDDIYVSQQQIKKYGLKTGDVVQCTVRPPHVNEKYFAMSTVSMINGRHPSEVRDRVAFEHLTPLFPDKKFTLCGDPQTTNPSVRIVDLFSPIGKGQRALIVAQPKTGKTILMKDIANAIAANHPEAYIMMLLIDERPEEVTDMARTVDAEVIASTFDEPAERHVKIAGIVLEKAKRMVECGHDVVIFLDSITRLARAYNTVAPASGKVLTGGVDANALQKPKRFFGAARNIEGGGSLTIIATALVDTGSKMDEVIFEEFKGTGNSEIQLNRALSNKRIFPAIDLVQSSTRRDDLLQDQTTLNRMWIIRKFIAEMNPIEAMNTVRDRLVQSRNNEEFLLSMNG